MGKDLLKHLQIGLSKLRRSNGEYGESDSSWIMSCKYPKTQSLRIEEGAKFGEGENSVVYRTCYNSLYVEEAPSAGGLATLREKDKAGSFEEFSKEALGFDLDISSKSSSDSSTLFSDSSRSARDLPPGLASAMTSQRFFFSPGRSNSILEEAKCSRTVEEEEEEEGEEEERVQNCESNSSCCSSMERGKMDVPCADEDEDEDEDEEEEEEEEEEEKFCSADLVENPCVVPRDSCCPEADVYDIFESDSVVVYMNSKNPYWDFRISMQEMVEALDLRDWDRLQEMVLCYLSLNQKRTHKFILGAFVDLVSSLAESSSSRAPLLETFCKDDDDEEEEGEDSCIQKLFSRNIQLHE